MKVAVTYENGMVFQHFGKCPSFLIAEVSDGSIQNRTLLSSGDSGHSALVTLLKEQHVEVLICGGIGQGARNALQEAGITLIAGAKGNGDVALDQYAAGILQDDPSGQCDHHHEEGEHHSCGEHTCH